MLYFIIGAVIGGIFMLILTSLMVAAKESDLVAYGDEESYMTEEEEDYEDENEEDEDEDGDN